MSEIFLSLHLLTLTFVILTIIRADHYGLSWIRGRVEKLDESKLNKFHRNIWVGLCLMILTGLTMFWPLREFLLVERTQQFFVKMTFVLGLIINGFVIGNLQKISTQKSFASLLLKEKLKLLVSGAVSTICWLGAIAGGYFLIP